MAARQNRDILRLKNKKIEKLEFMIKTKFNMKRNIALFFLSLLGLTAQPAQAVAKEAYAVVSPDGTTLTFYFDENKSSRQGTAYELNVGKDYPKWVRLNERSEPWNPNFKMVVFDESFKDARPVSCAYWFAEFTELTKIEGIANLNTSKVTDMNSIFFDCHSLENLDLSNFDTSNVTDMSEMFKGGESLDRLDLSSFDTSNVTDMSCMFSWCGLASLNISSFNTSKVTDMSGMFHGCVSLDSLDLSSFDTSNVTCMSEMFHICGLTSLDLSSFNTSKVTDMSCMFSACEGLTNLDLSHFDTSNVTDMRGMFYDCRSLKNLDISSFDTSIVTNIFSMFEDCDVLDSLDLSNFDTSNVWDMKKMFEGCKNLKTIYVGTGWNTNKVEESEEMFKDCISLVGGKGTKYNSEIVDKTRARVDGGKAKPGYFKLKLEN